FRAWRSRDRSATHPRREIGRFAVNTVLLREKSDTLSFDDPIPAVAELGCLVADGAGSLVRRASDIPHVRRLMRRRLLKRLATARSILFVCKGNVCRSPFAARAMERLCPGVRSSSAGYIGGDGRTSPAAAVRSAAEFDVSLEDHRS